MSLIVPEVDYCGVLLRVFPFFYPSSNISRVNIVVPRAGFEPPTTNQDSLGNWNDFQRDLEDYKLFLKSKMNFSQSTVYHYTSKVRRFLKGRTSVTEKDIQLYIEQKKQECVPDYVSNIISAFKAYFRDYRGLKIMNDYKHPQTPLRMKPELDPKEINAFIKAIEDLTVKCIALLLASSGLRKGEVLGLRKSDIDMNLRSIVPSCHTGETKHSGITFNNGEAEDCLKKYLAQTNTKSERLFIIAHEKFLKEWNRARAKTGLRLKPKDLRDFFSQESGKALIPDRYVDIFQGRAPKGVLAKHYTPQGVRFL